MTREDEAALEAKKALIEAQLGKLFVGDAEPLATFWAAANHAMSGGGKRVRPLLTLLVAEACGKGDEPDALRAAVAIELLHGYTLVHDDLPSMDNDTERRGAPSVWAKFGEATAILAGDYLQAAAFAQIAACEKAAALLPCLTHAAIEVIHGQVADIAATQCAPDTWSEETLRQIYTGKTCALIVSACALGAVAAEGAPRVVAAAETFGLNLGMAFQLIDDLLDAEQASVGNEFNALAVYHQEIDTVKALAQRYTQAALDALDALPGDTTRLRSFAEKLLLRRV